MSCHRAVLDELRHRPMVFVADLDAPALDDGDRHHLERVLRVGAGDPLTVADGAGRWRSATMGRSIEPTGPVVAEDRPLPPVVIAFSPVKGDRPDLVVQKLTELGVDTIVPLLTARSVVRWDEARAAKNLDRHRRIVREAAMQSRNPWLPTVAPLTPFPAFLDQHPEAVLADPAGQPGPVTACVAIGPEGGFTDDELAGRATVALPGRILRTETAAITAGALAVAGRTRPES